MREQDALRCTPKRIIWMQDKRGSLSERFKSPMQSEKEKVALGIDRRIRRPDPGQGRGRRADRLAGDPVGGRPFADRLRRHGDDLFRRAHLRQARRRGASLRPRQGRERVGAGRDGAAVRAVRRGDLGGGEAAAQQPGPCGGGDGRGLRRDHRVRGGRFLPRPPALSRGQRNRERGAGGRCAAFRLRHVVVDRGAGGPRRRRVRLPMGGFGRRRRRCGVRLHRRLAPRPPHHRDADRHRAAGLGRNRAARRRPRQRRGRGRRRAGAAGRRQAVRRGGGGGEPHAAARPRRRR